ncbi:MAG TPA: DUF6159 family protein [Vicinamibacterales bacterium]|nr:DUF6159 family protein [Vicinamibacterales bacterium]
MGRIGRSFVLMERSYRILVQDKELMVLPLISGAITVSVLAGVVYGFGIDAFDRPRTTAYVPLFLTYVVTYAIAIFFQAAVVAGATDRLRGGDPTVRSALAAASRRAGPIVLWAVVAATVGMVLRVIEGRFGFVGRIVARIAGASWALATFFVVPVLVLEDRSVGDSFTRSVSVFKRTWGETVVGGTSLGAAAVCAWVTLVAIVALLAYVIGVAAVAVLLLGAAFLAIFFSALQGIYIASLYRYATDGNPGGFDDGILKAAFGPKR